MARHFHDWQPTYEYLPGYTHKRQYVGVVCANGCGKQYKPPTQKQTEARRKNFHKMFVLGCLTRAKYNVSTARDVDGVQVRVALEAIEILIERARAEL